MCVDISYMDDDGAMFERAAEVLDRGMSGMQAAAASVILHCLKPFTFPIINGREAVSKLYKDLQIEITKAGNLTNYISNSRKIKEYRDTNFSFKNYRIFVCLLLKSSIPAILTGKLWIAAQMNILES